MNRVQKEGMGDPMDCYLPLIDLSLDKENPPVQLHAVEEWTVFPVRESYRLKTDSRAEDGGILRKLADAFILSHFDSSGQTDRSRDNTVLEITVPGTVPDTNQPVDRFGTGR